MKSNAIQSSISKKKNSKLSRGSSDTLWGYLFTAPTIIGLIILNVIPFLYTVYLSFNETGAFGNMKWAGVENYTRFFSDPVIWGGYKKYYYIYDNISSNRNNVSTYICNIIKFKNKRI